MAHCACTYSYITLTVHKQTTPLIRKTLLVNCVPFLMVINIIRPVGLAKHSTVAVKEVQPVSQVYVAYARYALMDPHRVLHS